MGTDENLLEVPLAANGFDAVLRIIGRVHTFITEQPTRLRAFLVVSFEAAGPSSIPLQRIADPLIELQDAISAAIQVGQADGSIRRGTDPDFTAERILDVGLGMAHRWLIDPENYDFAERVRLWRDDLAQTVGGDTAVG